MQTSEDHCAMPWCDEELHRTSSVFLKLHTTACNICTGLERTVNVTLAYKVCLQTALCCCRCCFLFSFTGSGNGNLVNNNQHVDKCVVVGKMENCVADVVWYLVRWNPEITQKSVNFISVLAPLLIICSLNSKLFRSLYRSKLFRSLYLCVSQTSPT